MSNWHRSLLPASLCAFQRRWGELMISPTPAHQRRWESAHKVQLCISSNGNMIARNRRFATDKGCDDVHVQCTRAHATDDHESGCQQQWVFSLRILRFDLKIFYCKATAEKPSNAIGMMIKLKIKITKLKKWVEIRTELNPMDVRAI